MIKKPIILADTPFDAGQLEEIVAKHGVREVVDIYKRQLQELERVRYAEAPGEAWIFYPWSKQLLHCVGGSALFALRTNRNKLLIDDDEQKQLHNAGIGIAGMSVGAGIATGFAYSGMSNRLKIADFDVLDTSNLNRLKESLLAVGRPKAELCAQHIYELDPFSEIEIYGEGLNDDNIHTFFTDPKLDLVFDEIDDFKMKVTLRLQAKKHRVPLVMFTSLGDNILIDVERYDSDKDLEPFHGLIPNLASEIAEKNEITEEDIKRYSVQLVGAEYIPTRALASVLEIGHKLAGRPQLYSTIAVDGGLAAYVARKILLDGLIDSGRYFIRFSDFFDMDSSELIDTPQRKSILKKLAS